MDLKSMINAKMAEVKNRVTPKEGKVLKHENPSPLSQEEKDFYKFMFGDDIASVRHHKLHCTACDIHIGSAPNRAWDMFEHPVLRTLLCSKCREFYGDGEFEQGEDATDMFCRWCANGGNLYCCSYCSNTFCTKCIKRNFDPVVRQKIEAVDKWKCFVCDPTDLYGPRALCWALLQHVQTVTRILQNDKNITKEAYNQKMGLDESECCYRRRKSKRRRQDSMASDEEDESYVPRLNHLSEVNKRKMSRKSSPLVSNGNSSRPNKSTPLRPLLPAPMRFILPAQVPLTGATNEPYNESENYQLPGEDDDDLLPPMIPCLQYMVEGESDTIDDCINSAPDPSAMTTRVEQSQNFTPQPLYQGLQTSETNEALEENDYAATQPPTLIKNPIQHQTLPQPQINPIPTANLLQTVPPPLMPVSKPAIRLGPRSLVPQTPQVSTVKYLPIKHSTPNNRPVEFNKISLRPQQLQPNVPMVAIPGTNTGHYKKPRVLLPRRKPDTSGAGRVVEPNVIDLDSDSDDCASELVSVSANSTSDGRASLPTNSHPDGNTQIRSPVQETEYSNVVHEEIKFRSKEVDEVLTFLRAKLNDASSFTYPNQNDLRITRGKMRQFHLAIKKAMSTLSDINDKVVHKYSSWRKSVLQETVGSYKSTKKRKSTVELDLPLDMTCTNSESESDSEYNSDDMNVETTIKDIQSFQERDTVDVGTGTTISIVDKSTQVYDVVTRDYEKCIGHSLLTKVEYNESDSTEILKTVFVPSEHSGKFEEQFIFFLQHVEEHGIETEDVKGLPDPNETPLKELIEANSPFISEMLENIGSRSHSNNFSPVAADSNNFTNKENERRLDKIDSSRVADKLVEIVTEIAEDLEGGKPVAISGKLNSSQGENVINESEEVDAAVQSLIEEDERSRGNSIEGDTDESSLHGFSKCRRQISNLSDDECTIID